MILTVSEAAERLKLSVQRVRQLVSQGRLQASRHGARVLMLDSASVDAFQPAPAGRPKKIEKILR